MVSEMNSLSCSSLIKLFKITGRKETIPVLLGLEAEFKSGALNFILGPSGSGKSTFFNLISGYILPDTGEIKVDEITLANQFSYSNKFQDEISHLKQNPLDNVFPNLSVKENFEIVIELKNLDITTKEIELLLDNLALKINLNKKINLFSYGQIQRLGLALVLIRKPKILLLDEPISYVDLYNTKIIMRFLKKYTLENNIITIITTHNQVLAKDFNKFVLYKGRFVSQSLSEIFKDYENMKKYYKSDFNTSDDLLSGLIEFSSIFKNNLLEIPVKVVKFLGWSLNTWISVKKIDKLLIINQGNLNNCKIIEFTENICRINISKDILVPDNVKFYSLLDINKNFIKIDLGGII
jgi:ABC-type multidrug transport system ATPase subunit